MTNDTGFASSDYITNINKFDFYSGSQITVWFGNILIDDINSIQWIRTQSKRPIFGYASQLFDGIAKGIVLIQGNFSINFRQTGYLSAVMLKIKNLYNTVAPTDATQKVKFNQSEWPVIRDLIGTHLKNGTFGPQSVQDIQDMANSPDFFDLAKSYQDIIWGGNIEGATTSAVDIQQTNTIPDGFNILITYGNLSHSEAQTLSQNMQSTVKVLNNVHLTGESQVIQVGGQPIQEQYSFIARTSDDYSS